MGRNNNTAINIDHFFNNSWWEFDDATVLRVPEIKKKLEDTSIGSLQIPRNGCLLFYAQN